MLDLRISGFKGWTVLAGRSEDQGFDVNFDKDLVQCARIRNQALE